jgi:broad specificity phosphatase PhoE
MKLYIIRHGETLWNTAGKLQGTADIELNENGIRLAEVTSKGMKDIPFDLAFTSPLKRAKQTAEIVLGNRAVPLMDDDRIKEITFGEWEGLCCRKDNYQIPSREFPKFFSDPFHYQPPSNGESIADVIRRTDSFYQDLLSNPGYQDKNILIACHGCSSRALLYNIENSGNDFWRNHVPPNCGVTIASVRERKAELLDIDKIYYSQKDLVDFYGVG